MIEMRALWKIMVLVFCAAIVLGATTGCDRKTGDIQQASADRPLLAKLQKQAPMPLEDIELKSVEALDLASDTVDALEDDQYLIYINNVKDRDRKEVEVKAVDPLQALADAFADTFASIATGIADAFTGAFADTDFGDVTDDSNAADSAGGDADTGDDTADDSGDTGDDTADSDDRYFNSLDGFSIVFPDGWGLTEGEDGEDNTVKAESGFDGSDDKFLENILVATEELVIPLDLNEYADGVITALAADLTDFEELGRTEVDIGATTKAKRIVYTHTSGGTALKSVTYIIVGDFKGYKITGTAEKSKFSSYESKFDDAAESFQFE